MPGTLYWSPRPSEPRGITLRALRVLRNATWSRRGHAPLGTIAEHFGIPTTAQLFQFNEAKRSEEIIERLRRGEKGRAGHGRGQSRHRDPGERVVKGRLRRASGRAVPGACAWCGATASGLPAENFITSVSWPHKSGQRRTKVGIA